MNQTGKAGHTSPAKVSQNALDTHTAQASHAFAHLGEYPYTYIGYEYLTYQACPGAPIQVGGICDHCFTGIKDAFHFRKQKTNLHARNPFLETLFRSSW